MAKMTLKIRVDNLHFNNSWECPEMHVWCKFGGSNSNLWRVIVRTSKVYGQTQTDNDITPPPHGLKGQGLKMESTFKAFAEAEQQIALTEDKLNIHCSS